MLSIEDRPLGDIAVQYKETDWIFLKRMLSQLHAAISCRVASETLQLYGGVPDVVKEKWDYEVKGYQKELGIYNYWLQLGMNVSDTDFFVTEIETNHVPELFEEVEDAGKPIVIQNFSFNDERATLLFLQAPEKGRDFGTSPISHAPDWCCTGGECLGDIRN